MSDTSASNLASSSPGPASRREFRRAYQPPRVEPLGTLPASTGMPVSQFQLGDEPVR